MDIVHAMLDPSVKVQAVAYPIDKPHLALCEPLGPGKGFRSKGFNADFVGLHVDYINRLSNRLDIHLQSNLCYQDLILSNQKLTSLGEAYFQMKTENSMLTTQVDILSTQSSRL